MAKSEPAVPTANVWVAAVRVFRVVIPVLVAQVGQVIVLTVRTRGELKVRVLSLLLNVDQSVEERAPRFEAEAVGKLKVCVSTEDTTAKSEPEVPIANS